MDVVSSSASPALEARDLYRFFHAEEDETFALRGVSMSIDRGEMVAVVGPSGSGKSTLLACLAGLDEPDGGSVSVAGQRMTRRSEAVRAGLRAKGIGVLVQSGNLLEHLSVAGNVALAQRLADAPDRARLDDVLSQVGLLGRADARPSTLSGGETARAGLAVALANDPDVVLADEPTGELDRISEGMILELLVERAKQGGAVCVVTHSSRVADAAHRIVRLEDGSIVDA